MKCSEDVGILKRIVEKDKIYTFLTELDVEFDDVRVQVLGKDLSSLNETIGIIRGEESRRGEEGGYMFEPQPMESSAMVVRGANEKSDGADHQLSTILVE